MASSWGGLGIRDQRHPRDLGVVQDLQDLHERPVADALVGADEDRDVRLGPAQHVHLRRQLVLADLEVVQIELALQVDRDRAGLIGLELLGLPAREVHRDARLQERIRDQERDQEQKLMSISGVMLISLISRSGGTVTKRGMTATLSPSVRRRCAGPPSGIPGEVVEVDRQAPDAVGQHVVADRGGSATSRPTTVVRSAPDTPGAMAFSVAAPDWAIAVNVSRMPQTVRAGRGTGWR